MPKNKLLTVMEIILRAVRGNKQANSLGIIQHKYQVKK